MDNQAGRRTNIRTSEDGIEAEDEQWLPHTPWPEPSNPITIPGQPQHLSLIEQQTRPDTPRAMDQREAVRQADSMHTKQTAVRSRHLDTQSEGIQVRSQPVTAISQINVGPPAEQEIGQTQHKHMLIRQHRALAYVLARGEFMDDPQQNKTSVSSPVDQSRNVSSFDIEVPNSDEVFQFSYSPKSEHVEFARPSDANTSRWRQDENQIPFVNSPESRVKYPVSTPDRNTSRRERPCPRALESNARRSLEQLLQRNDSAPPAADQSHDVSQLLPRSTRRHSRTKAIDLTASSSLSGHFAHTGESSNHIPNNSVQQNIVILPRRPRSTTFDCGSMPMKLDEPSATAAKRGRSWSNRVTFAEIPQTRTQSAAPTGASEPLRSSKGMPLEELIDMMADETRASFRSIQGEAIPAKHKATEQRMREATMQYLNSPSTYELMPPEVQSQVHPMDMAHDQRPWPWNTQPENLPFGVAANSIHGLNNIGWVCQGAKRLSADLNDDTDESAFAVEQARNRWAQNVFAAQRERQRHLERSQSMRRDATPWHYRQLSHPITRSERNAQITNSKLLQKKSSYEIVYARDGRAVRFPTTSEHFADDETNRITSSVPLHYQLLDGQTEQPQLLLIRTRTIRPRPEAQSRSRSAGPPRDSPRPPPRRSFHFSLDGACDLGSEAASDPSNILDSRGFEEAESLFSEDVSPLHCFADDPLFKPRREDYITRSGVRLPFGDDGMSPSLSLGYLNSATYSNNGSMPSQNMVRQAPSPQGPAQQGQMQQQQPQAAQQQANGMNGAVNSAAALQASLGHAGHQPDFNYLWGIVQELTDALAHNRAQTASMISGVQQIQARAREEGGELPTAAQVNGELLHASEIADLQNQLHEMTRERDDYAAQHNESIQILTDYERTMDSLMIKIREYANNHAKAIIGVHQHYEAQLAAEREANLQLRIEHGQWQAGLGKATELARLALRQRSEETSGLETGLRDVKAENRILRKILGWEVEDSSDEEDGIDSNIGIKLNDGGPMRAPPGVPGI